MIIGIDMDDTLYGFVPMVLDKYNSEYKDNVKKEDITSWNIHQFLKPECKNVFSLVNDELFESITIEEDAKEFVERLFVKKHEVYFVTAGHPKTIQARDRLLKRNFKKFNSENLIMCRQKNLLHLDILIDDCADYFSKDLFYKYDCFLKVQPWNKNSKLPVRIFKFNKFEDLKRFMYL